MKFSFALLLILGGLVMEVVPAPAEETVTITEFLASNNNNYPDEDGDFSDWIEIYNSGANAVNLGGWYLTDDVTQLTKWRLPSMNLAAKGFLVVFASGKDRAVPGAPLHASFSLNAGGEYLALVHPDGVTIASEFVPQFPEQSPNVSYGIAQQISVTRLVSSNAAVRVWVPTNDSLGLSWTTNSFDDAAWLRGTNGVGYETTVPGFAVRNVKATGLINGGVADAQNVVTNGSRQSAVYSENVSFINYLNTGGGGHFGSDRTFPGLIIGVESDDFAVEATAIITIPAAGNWSFGVNSDDGFSLSVGSFVFSFPMDRGAADTLATFNFPAAGDYPLRLVFYERAGGSAVELFAAPGSIASWNAALFDLVGDTANGGLAVRSSSSGVSLSYRSLIRTDVQSRMFNQNASAFIRLPFAITNVAAFTSLTLQMKYDDGFVAYLNGQEAARRNAPVFPPWNSSATATHSNQLAVVFENINLSERLELLQEGENLLAIQGLNSGLNDVDFLIATELAEFKALGTTNHYFSTPSPGALNGTGFLAFVADTKFSHNRGFYETNFSLSITSATAGALIRYTTNGTAPSLTNGIVYSTPLLIQRTTIIRAAAFKAGFEPSDVDTHTYIFLNDVITQSANGAAPPGWPTSWGRNVVDYGMDPDVVNNPVYNSTIKEDLKSLPSFSIVMDLKDLFNPTTGIYANPEQDGIDWERAASLELIHPDGREGFQENAGVRIRGGFSRSTDNPKHAFRLFFRQEYGAAKLDYPVFGGEGAGSFDAFDLRCAQNYSWSFQGDGRGVFLRDQFSRDTQLDMGRPSTRGDFYHLYINGQYWGLYNTQERPEASYAESYFGGDKEDYDVIKVEAGPYNINATDGNLQAWTRLYNLAEAGLASDAAYQRIQGNNPDGTRNPALENLLDVPNLLDYMLVILYGGNLDAPISNFLGNGSPNNWYGIRNRNGTAGFRFFAHDSEHTLLNVDEDRTGPYPAGDAGSGGLVKSNPQRLWQQLQANAEFRLLVADHIQRHFFNGGTLTYAAATNRFLKRKLEIDRAVVGESARWGDAKRATPFTRNADWVNAVNDVLNSFFPQRSTVVFNQLWADALYPNIAAAVFNQHGGTVPPGFALTITNSNPGGNIFFTVDGSDPRLRDGNIASSAQAYSGALTLNGYTVVRVRIKDGVTWSALVEAAFYPQQDFTKLLVSEIMYNPPAAGSISGDEFEFVELKNVGGSTLDLSGISFESGIGFTFTNGTLLAPGQFFVLVRNVAQFQSKYPGVAVNGVYTNRLDNGGETLRLAHILGTTALSVTYDDLAPWPVASDGYGYSLVSVDPNANPAPDNGLNWRASAAVGGSPGVNDPMPTIPRVLVNEVLTHTDPPQVDAIELHNPTPSGADISGWFLTDDPALPKKFRVPNGTMIPAGGFVVFSETNFNANSGVPTSFTLSSQGEQVYLFSADAGGNLSGYSHGFDFGAAASGVSFGRYVTSIGEEHFPAQAALTLGMTNAGPKVGPVVISEILYHPLPDYDEFVELKNITSEPVPLYDPAFPTNRWKLEGAGFTFPANIVLPPNECLLVVPIAPAAFRSKYTVPAHVQILGPYGGMLQDSGERLELQRPDTPDTNRVPYITVDEVRYNDKAPWPPAADGDGPSLQRLDLAAYGNDPTNWFTSALTPGRTNALNSPPTVSLIAPANGASFAGPTNITLEATASDNDGAVSKVEFFQNGVKVGEATNNPYRFTWLNVGPDTYTLTARATDNGFAISNSIPVVITVQPPPAGTGVGLVADYFDTINFIGAKITRTNATVNFDWGTGPPDPQIGPDTFSVRWLGRVQPRYSGTYTFYTVSDDGVRLWVDNQTFPIIDNWTDHGPTENSGSAVLMAGELYDIRMEFYENGGGATAKLSWSAPFVPKQIIPQTQLYPFFKPAITTQPISQNVRISNNATLTVVAIGTAPLNYQWRYNGLSLAGATNASLLLTNVGLSAAGGYSVIISNFVGSITSVVVNLKVIIPPIITQHPQSQTVVAGDNVTFSVRVVGTPPFGFRWRRTNVTVVPFGQGTLSFTITNVQLSQANSYDVIITNMANTSPGVQSGPAVLTVLADSDGDHIPNNWEIANGFNTNLVSDAALDTDGDGMTNFEEYKAGTDPNESESVLRLGEVAIDGNDVRIGFRGVQGKKYRLERQEDIAADIWRGVFDFRVGSVLDMELIDTGAASRPNRIYRITLLP